MPIISGIASGHPVQPESPNSLVALSIEPSPISQGPKLLDGGCACMTAYWSYHITFQRFKVIIRTRNGLEIIGVEDSIGILPAMVSTSGPR